MSRLLWRASRRVLTHHPWQLALAVIGIALGVATVVAVELATGATDRAFHYSAETLQGRATHQVIGGSAGLDESLYVRLRLTTTPAAAPVLEAYGTVQGEILHLLGIDPLAEGALNVEGGPHPAFSGLDEATVTRLVTEPRTVLASQRLVQRLGLVVHEPFTLMLAGRTHRLTLIGVLEGAQVPENLLVADIATAQELTDLVGRLSWIDLILPNDPALEARVRALLPQDAELIGAGTRTQALARLTEGFEINLTALSGLALIVGMFLIYNTVTFTVLRRRHLIGTWRLLGVTARETFQVVLGEAAVLGLIGTLLGLGAGVILGQGLVGLVSRTINDLYFVLTVTDMPVPPGSLVKGLLLGLGTSLVAALIPALEASGGTARSALSRATLEGRVGRLAPRLTLTSMALVATAIALLVATHKSLVAGFAALSTLVLGLTLMVPQAVGGMSRLATHMARRNILRLALRGISATLSRTGIAVAALMLAVTTTVGVELMVKSFRHAVADWLNTVLRADIYVSVPGLGPNHTGAGLDPGLIERITHLPAIAGLTTGRSVRVESASGLVEVFAVDQSHRQNLSYRLKAEGPNTWEGFFQGQGVLVSEPLAFYQGLHIGDRISLRTDSGMRPLPVLGVYTDYESGPGKVLMHRALYDQLWQDRAIDALGLFLAPGMNTQDVIAVLRTMTDQPLTLYANRELYHLSLAIFDQTFTITEVLRILALVVAGVGILSAFMALSLERAREIAILRATGFTRAGITGLITLQSGFLGLMAGLIALPVGILLSLVLIEVINRRAFGWSMELVIDPGTLGLAVGLAVTAAVLAGLYPALRMARTAPAALLSQE